MANKKQNRTGIKVSGDGLDISISDENAGKVTDGITSLLSVFLDIASPVSEGLGFLGDKIRNARIRNAASIANEIRKLQSDYDREFLASEIDTKNLVNLIRNSTLDDDERMQRAWAHLVANASISNDEYLEVFIDILSRLNFNDIENLKICANLGLGEPFSESQVDEFSKLLKEKLLDIPKIRNLIRSEFENEVRHGQRVLAQFEKHGRDFWQRVKTEPNISITMTDDISNDFIDPNKCIFAVFSTISRSITKLHRESIIEPFSFDSGNFDISIPEYIHFKNSHGDAENKLDLEMPYRYRHVQQRFRTTSIGSEFLARVTSLSV